MPPRKAHRAKGWAAALDRTSLVRTDIDQDSSENQQRLNRQTARAFGLKIKPGYDFSEHGTPASKPITRRELQRGIDAVVKEKAVEALLVSSVDRLSRLGMRHVGQMPDAVDAVGGRIIFNKGNLDSSQAASLAIIVQRDIRLVDEFVTEAVLSALESPELAEGLRVDSSDHAKVKQLVADIKTYEARIQRAADACYVHDRISEDTYLDTAAQLDGMIAQARGELRRLALARAVTVLPEEAITAADIRREWSRRDLAW